MDPATGNLVSAALHGGAEDESANGVATNGTDLYVAGETKSFGGGGSDLMLLRFAVGTPPSIGMHPTPDGKLELTWSVDSRLQHAPTITGPWEDVPGATSPFRVHPTAGKGFYRLVSE